MSGVLRAPVRLSRLALDVVCESERLPERHHVFTAAPVPAETYREFAAVQRRVLDELTGVGLVVRDAPHPDLVTALRLLARPHREFYGYFSTDEMRSGSFLAAADAADGVLAILDGEVATLVPVDADRLDVAAVQALPRVPPARITPIAVAEADLVPRRRAATAEGEDSFLVPARPTRESAALRRARALLGKPRTGGGMLYAAVRDRSGRRRRAAGQISYVDVVPEGRTVVEEQSGPDGTRWITLRGAEPDLLARMLRQLAAGITPASRRQ